MSRIIDLFAGPGGWCEGLRALGRHGDCLGIEWDEAACETARAAGHDRLQADIAELDPATFGPVEGLIASPPCQSFSTAGKQKGRADREHVIACAHEIAAGFDSRWQYGGLLADERSLLTVEPLRWALALRPRWIAFEQVPAVLELWSIFAQILGVEGYSTDVGILTAEQYGVPQTRKRAYLVASLDGEVRLPAPTHTKYRKGKPKQEGDLLPWVSMAEALGWTEGVAVRFGNQPNSAVRTVDEPAATLRFSGRMNACDWLLRTGNFSAVARDADGTRSRAGSVPYERTVDDPSPTVTGNADRWTLRQNARANGTARRADEPAPTITAGHDSGDRRWCYERPSPTIVCTRRSRDGILVGRQLPPGEGVNVGGKNWTPPEWAHDRPATSIRVSVEEASILMGFRPDYPWRGSRTKQFQQIGNAVCPPMGRVVLAAAMGLNTRDYCERGWGHISDCEDAEHCRNCDGSGA